MIKLYVCRALLVLLSLACAAAALVSAPAALMTSVMVFDAPGSEQLWWVWAASVAILSIPAWFAAGAALGWLVHLRGWVVTSVALAAAPLVAAVVLWVALAG